MRAVLGVDVGTSSTKGILVTLDGTILGTAVREHSVNRPEPGMVEMDAAQWWKEFSEISRELLTKNHAEVIAVGVSGMGPCVTIADESGQALRPAILYGVDTRATEQIRALTLELGETEIVDRCGSALSTQSVGPKLAWLGENEPAAMERAKLLFMPSSWLAFHLTGNYVLDHHSASQCTPMYDTMLRQWHQPWSQLVAPNIDLPALVWPGDIIGAVTASASEQTMIPAGVAVIAGTIDAWSEAISVGAQNVGDLMLMYGTTMFLINTTDQRLTSNVLWGTIGAIPGTHNLAGGMATSGAITGWLRELVGSPDYSDLIAEASESGPGGRGLVMLPYFAGERTPIADPKAKGLIAGLTLDHNRGDLYRATLEATAFGVRHNIEALATAGGQTNRVVAVGGGTQGGLWTQVVSDVTGHEQEIPTITIGASFGAAFLAASAVADVSIESWNPISRSVKPRRELTEFYDELYAIYRELYVATAALSHRLGDAARLRT